MHAAVGQLHVYMQELLVGKLLHHTDEDQLFAVCILVFNFLCRDMNYATRSEPFEIMCLDTCFPGLDLYQKKLKTPLFAYTCSIYPKRTES